MDGLWSVPHDAIRAAASRKCGLPLWRAGAVRVTSGLYATCHMIAGPVVTVYERDIVLADAVAPVVGLSPSPVR